MKRETYNSADFIINQISSLEMERSNYEKLIDKGATLLKHDQKDAVYGITTNSFDDVSRKIFDAAMKKLIGVINKKIVALEEEFKKLKD